MKKILGLMCLIVLMITSGCNQESDVPDKTPVTFGYCPTMAELAEEIRTYNHHISLEAYGSTGQALSALNKGQVDAVLVGRLAKASELNDAFEIRLRDGLTLVGRQKIFLSLSELEESNIHTYVSEERAREYLPETKDIVYHDSFETAIKEGLDDMVLIDWHDFSDNLELVIPVDAYMNKVEKFRIPVLYSFDKEKIEYLDI